MILFDNIWQFGRQGNESQIRKIETNHIGIEKIEWIKRTNDHYPSSGFCENNVIPETISLQELTSHSFLSYAQHYKKVFFSLNENGTSHAQVTILTIDTILTYYYLTTNLCVWTWNEQVSDKFVLCNILDVFFYNS